MVANFSPIPNTLPENVFLFCSGPVRYRLLSSVYEDSKGKVTWSDCGSSKETAPMYKNIPPPTCFGSLGVCFHSSLKWLLFFFCFTIPSLTKRARVSLANFLLTLNKRALSCLHAFAIIIAGSVSRPAPSQGIIINRLFADCLPFPPPRLARANERTIAPPYARRTLFTTPLLTIFLLLSHYLVYKG